MAIKIKNRVFLRVFNLFAILVLAIILFFTFMLIPMQKNSFLQIMYTQGGTVSRSIIQACSDAIINNDFGFIVEHNVEVLKNNPSILFITVSPIRGNTIIINKSGWRMIDKPEQKLIDLQTDKIEHQINQNQWQAEGYKFVYPINFSGVKWGWLHIEFNTEEYNSYLKEMVFQLLYVIAVAIVLIIILGYFFARWVTRPVLVISGLATQVANGNLDVRSSFVGHDEIGALSASFNKMVESLQQSKNKLENYNQKLEHEVRKRTFELDTLNQNLDKKVKEEVLHRQEQERLLIHQSRLAAMGEMIGAIAHQWRQPLNALSLVLQNQQITYQSGKLNDQFMKRSMEKSDRLINKMSTTIDDFRNFFKPNKQVEEFNINGLIHSTVELLDAQLKSHSIEVNIKCEKNLNISGYPGEFSQVIINLLDNAKDILLDRKIKSPAINIIAHQINQTILINIHDNAGGIPSNIIHQIYDPYFTTKDEGKGTGIGLYMSKMIVENNMKGKLSAYNAPEGANFIIEIPVHQKKATHDPAEE